MTPSATPAAGETAVSEISLLGLAATVLQRWRLIALLGIAGAMIAAAWSLVAAPRFRTSLKFALQAENINPSLAQFSALAGQLGVVRPEGARSLQFYADVLTGETLLRRLAQDSFADDSGEPRQLMDLLQVRGESSTDRLANAVARLKREAVNTSTDDRTGTVTLQVTLPDPQLASHVTSKLFDELQLFNVDAMRTSATERRRFAEREATRARMELDSAEAGMRAFLDANRGGLDNSPRLAFQRTRIQRRIDLLNDQFRRLETEREQARIDAVRDTPVLTLVEQPVPPIHRDYPRRVRMTLTGGILGGLVALALIALGVAAGSARNLDPEGYQRLHDLVRGYKRP